MPTTRKRHTRNLRQEPDWAIKEWFYCRLTNEEFAEHWGNIYAQCSLTDKTHAIGAQVFELWKTHGEELLKRAGYTGITRHPEFCAVIYYGDIHKNLSSMLSSFGQPWKDDEL